MENTLASKIDFKEVAITAGIVLVGGFVICLAALYAKEGLDKAKAKKAAAKKDSAKV
jgi:hypothetical protein